MKQISARLFVVRNKKNLSVELKDNEYFPAGSSLKNNLLKVKE